MVKSKERPKSGYGRVQNVFGGGGESERTGATPERTRAKH